jgi:hypothetical protein
VSRFLVVATSGAGGDLQPLVSAALALREAGHETPLAGDRSVQRSLSHVGLEVEALPPELDLGPRLSSAIRDAMTATGGDPVAAGPIVQERMAEWARDVAGPVSQIIERQRPDAVVTSLFGVEVLHTLVPSCPWAVINSTFYIGPNPPRPIEQDVGARAIPLLSRYASLLGSAGLVPHATDQLFDSPSTGFLLGITTWDRSGSGSLRAGRRRTLPSPAIRGCSPRSARSCRTT